MGRRPEVARRETRNGPRECAHAGRADSTQDGREEIGAELRRFEAGSHLEQRGDRIPRGQERPVLPEVEEDERVEARSPVREDRLERARGLEPGRGKRHRRRAPELVNLKPERSGGSRENRNAVDNPRGDLTRGRPEPEIHVRRGGHRIPGDEERDLAARRGGENHLAVLHLLPRQPVYALADELLDCIAGRVGQSRRVPLREHEVGRLRRVEFGFPVEEREFNEGFVPIRSYKDVVVVPEALRRSLPTAFDVIGDIAVIKIPEELRPYRDEIGRAILRWNTKIRVAVEDRGVRGDRRIRSIEIIAGERRTATIHTEHGLRSRVDLANAYFSPLLASEPN